MGVRMEIQKTLSKSEFIKGTDILQGVFANINCNLDVLYEFVKDLNPKDYFFSIDNICKRVECIFNGTNMVALIRDNIYSDNVKKYLIKEK